MAWYYNDWKPYVPVAERRRRAMKKMDALAQEGSGRPAGRRSTAARSPRPSGAKPGATTWNRSATTRTACRAAAPTSATARSATWRSPKGQIEAKVSGSELYTVQIEIKTLPAKKWNDVKRRCTGQIGSLLELLQGSLSEPVMEVVTDRQNGLFPLPGEISLRVQLPRLGRDVQARGGGALRRRRPAGPQARAAVHVARRQPRGTDRRRRRGGRFGRNGQREIEAACRRRTLRRVRHRSGRRQL